MTPKTVFIPERNHDGSDRIANLAALGAVGRKYGIVVNYTQSNGDLGYNFKISEGVEFDEFSFSDEAQQFVEDAMEKGRCK